MGYNSSCIKNIPEIFESNKHF